MGLNGTAMVNSIDPTGIAVDSNTGNIFIVDSGNNRIQKFMAIVATFITKWSTNGANNIIKTKLPGIAVNPSGEVYQTGNANQKDL